MGKYTKQKDGRYRTGVFTGEYYDDGRRKMKYLSARTIKELDEKVEQAHADIRDSLNIIDSNVTFGEYAERWLRTYKSTKSIRTIEMYSRIIRTKLQAFCDIAMADLSRSMIQDVININSAYPRTCEQIHLTVKQICSSAVDDGVLRRTPCSKINLPRHVKEERRALTESEKDAIRTANLTERERAFVSVLMGTGMRPAEMYALTWSDIKPDSISINKSLTFDEHGNPSVVYPKTNSSIRTVQAPDFVFKSLNEYRRTSDSLSLIVFGGQYGQYRSKKRYAGEWERIKSKIESALGKPTEITPYYFRHNFASACYYSGISLLEAQRLLGHASYEMLMKIYTHLDAEKEDTKKKLNAINF